ncbi:MAG: hypothetical protein LBF78_03815 [Treponema sp.]|jgi:hypothetical protein|nr:hypothetical protein [Treponema sp.]
MKKPVFVRIFFILLLYGAVFSLLVMVQFARQGGFTRRIGTIVVSGQYKLQNEGASQNAPGKSAANTMEPNQYPLSGDASVFFGGMEFRVGTEEEDSAMLLVMDDGTSGSVLPESMIISGESVLFTLPGGTVLRFNTRYSSGAQELRISCDFTEGVSELELPFKPQRKTSMRDTGDGQFIIISDGMNYSFGRSLKDSARRVLFLKAGGADLSYGVIPEERSFSPDDFVISEARTKAAYEAALGRWLDQNFSFWNRTVSASASGIDEDMVAAFAGEALNRGTYKAAVAAVPQRFLNGNSRGYLSAVYLGGLGEAQRALSASDREALARLSRIINYKNADFLKESHVIEFFAVRGLGNFLDDAAEIIRSMDPKALPLDLTAGILEAYMDWKASRPLMENPFERMLDQARHVISGALGKTADSEKVFVLFGGRCDTEFNLRLGRALLLWAESAEDDSWAAVARSLILSSFSPADNSGSVRAFFNLDETGEITSDESSPRLSAARLYRVLRPGKYAPKTLTIGASVNSIWTWTCAAELSASQENNALDISVSFPSGDTHYMIIRGIKPFTKLQLYGIDFRMDPQFERYDSSGWAYVSSEQTLLVKMKHRTSLEHIRIFY